jgi:hypothetical protein
MATMQYMQARLIAKAKEVRDDGSIVEIVIWQVPTPVHDNERGKGDHRHWGDTEAVYGFTNIEQLLADFE